MKTLIGFLIKSQLKLKHSASLKTTNGFTMIELLVGTIITFLLITPLLSFVVDILNTDVREQAKANSAQEVQTAVDYIAQDISQAVYIYDSSKDNSGNYNDTTYNTFATQLQQGDLAVNPVLVFWKRQVVEDAVPIDIENDICPPENANDDCDDAYVMSLVAYYLLPGEQGIWCQPEGGNCPQRIARLQIQDGVKKLDGTYLCGSTPDPCSNNDVRRIDQGFASPKYSTDWTKGNGNFSNAEVLVNYIDDFEVEEVTDSNDFAKVKIIGNALRRVQANVDVCDDASTSAYCVKVNAQIGKRSGFGE